MVTGSAAAQKPHCARDDARVQSRGNGMRGLLAVLAILAVAFLAPPRRAEAQQMHAGSMTQSANRQNDRPGGAPPPQEKPTKRANEKDYKSALDRLPDQKYDPWAKTR